jgi:protein TonB
MVVVQFIVAKDGTVSDIKALTRYGYGMEQEVVRIIKKSPKWSPAQQNGRTVNAYRKQPITFVVQEEKKKRKLF